MGPRPRRGGLKGGRLASGPGTGCPSFASRAKAIKKATPAPPPGGQAFVARVSIGCRTAGTGVPTPDFPQFIFPSAWCCQVFYPPIQSGVIAVSPTGRASSGCILFPARQGGTDGSPDHAVGLNLARILLGRGEGLPQFSHDAGEGRALPFSPQPPGV